ncbi:hypothetical protein BOTBODRAFT_61102 [Botryobasidium botryosum FD-172 SS1]|uniref:AMP-dependent synthetase/ligase domain-containing protein n=1 Tax=Botryobasidium botryosum (strain FD-172 SS1) TaxID=930990 RepID=A0A067NBB4_BOTB1|nr:hypothetical protein BOTBODRAFT_61102 [Botryobasidium botryosum FD-172 SS1]
MTFAYPVPPTKQAANSATFITPPIDGSMSIPQMIDFHLANNPNHPVFRFATSGSSEAPFEEFLWRNVGQAMHRAARLAQARILGTPSNHTNSTTTPVIAAFASVELVHFSTFMYGVSRGGYLVHLISPQLSPAVIAHLFLKTDVTHVFVDESFRGLVKSVVDELQKAEAAIIPVVLDFPAVDDLFVRDDHQFEALPPIKSIELDSAAIILDSSGTTSLPKPIYITHRRLVEWSRVIWHGDRDLCGEVVGMQSALPFYVWGNFCIISALTGGYICAVRSPFGKPPPMTPERFIGEVAVTQCTILVSAPPSMLEAWANDPSALATLSKLKAVVFGGVFLREDVGAALSANAVPLTPIYGLTEAGCLSTYIPYPAEWDFFEFSSQIPTYLKPVENQAGLFEVFLLSSSVWSPQVLNTEINGKPAYATKDLVAQHPTNPNKYKIVGRLNDQLVFATGMKLNPLAVELQVKASPLVKSALVFGEGRATIGILIEPVGLVDNADPEALSAFREAIWKTIDNANETLIIYGHIRIAKEMVLVTSPSKPFLYTDKGSVKRPLVLKLYAEEIEAAYAAGNLP